MIRSWKGRSAEAVFQGRAPKGFPANLFYATRRKLARLDAATSLDDLRSPPGNQLHALSGNRKGQWSIRVNDQFRICFVWTSSGPENVEFVDYH
jgi:toxin HigB-1